MIRRPFAVTPTASIRAIPAARVPVIRGFLIGLSLVLLGGCSHSGASSASSRRPNEDADIRVLGGVEVSGDTVVGFTLQPSSAGFYDALGHHVKESDIAAYARDPANRTPSGQVVFNLATENDDTTAGLRRSIRQIEATVSAVGIRLSALRINVLIDGVELPPALYNPAR